MRSGQRIGLFGGTFDPVHNGHLAVADQVKEAFSLDSVWFIPAAVPPHKKKHNSGQIISSFEDRAAMLERALTGREGFSVSRIECERSQPSYTIDTLTQIRQQLGSRTSLFFIVGADAFLEIATWKDYDQLFSQADFVVTTRSGFQLGRVEEVVRQCFRTYRHHSKECVWRPKENVWLPADEREGKIYFFEMKPVQVSSTEIRRMVCSGLSIQQLVPHEVERYIQKHHCYRDTE